MRVVEIVVNKLFGLFNHTIPLNTEERITIIYGQNGVGKTILLKMLNGLFNGQYSELFNIPFKQFQVKFEDGSTVWVDKRFAFDKQSLPKVEINFSKAGSTEAQSFILTTPNRRDIPLSILEDILPVKRISRDEWEVDGKILITNELLLQFNDMIPSEFRKEEPDWWDAVQEKVKIHLIETQRLVNLKQENGYNQTTKTVEDYVKDLSEIIKTRLAESVNLSQKLDRSFPARLVKGMGRAKITQGQLQDKLDKLEVKRSELRELGILDKEEATGFLVQDIADSTVDVLAIYAQDVAEKLGVFDDLADRITLFKEIINKRFLCNKMTISKQKGFIFTFNDRTVPASGLSLGEQHELVLLYQLLFKAEPDSLVLIDEPELSLHIVWQQQFLEDMRETMNLSSFNVLIATHSPDLVDDWDLTVELEGAKL